MCQASLWALYMAFITLSSRPPSDDAETEGRTGEFPEAPMRGAKAEAEGPSRVPHPVGGDRRGTRGWSGSRLAAICLHFLRIKILDFFFLI